MPEPPADLIVQRKELGLAQEDLAGVVYSSGD